MKHLRLLYKYLIYLFRSRTRHGVHSPFVYSLVDEVIYNKSHFYTYDNIERLRRSLLRSNELVTVHDFGAGSQYLGKKNKRKVSDIARTSAKSSKYGKLLFRLVSRFQPSYMLEFGTSLGISTMYQAAAASPARFVTLEGSEEIATIAGENFEKLGVKVERVIGPFSETLIGVLKEFPKLDYVFFDGDHRKKATLDYFEQCVKLAHNDSLFVFDDIHWSEEMEEAWEDIKRHPQVTVTIDLFAIGLVFFRKEQPREHFIIRY